MFDQYIKIKPNASNKLVEMSRNDDSTKGKLLDFSDHQKYFKLIGKNLSMQTNTSIPQQDDYKGKLEEEEKQQKYILNFSLDLLIVTEWYKQWNILNL